MNKEELNLTDPDILRKRAEEVLKEKQIKASLSDQESDTNKLLHELQVHQIELEMQNEELKEANATSENALRKYTMLYDFAPMGYLTLSSDASITDLNFTAAELLKEKRFSLVNTNFKLFVANESKPLFNKFFDKVYSDNLKESCEVMLGYDNKPLCYVYMEAVVTGEDRKCLLSLVDITSFKKEEA